MAQETPGLDIDPSSLLYRIQSVDFNLYLELYDAVDFEKVVLRASKEDLSQQWMFQLVPGKKSFKILNATTERLNIPLYLTVEKPYATPQPNAPPRPSSISTANIVCKGEPEDPADPQISQWSVKQVNNSNAISITCPSKKGYLYFLHVDKNGKLGCVEEKISNNPSPIKQDRQWRQLEVSQSLVTDNYRIRTLNGTALHMTSSGTLSVENVDKGVHQEWKVIWHGNGKCTIQNFAEGLYLGWEERKEDVVIVRRSKEPKPWYITTLGEYTYTITYRGLDGKKTPPLSLTCGEERQVVLKTNKIAHNRIWMFEPVDITPSDDQDNE